jgi:hypothetical protein
MTFEIVSHIHQVELIAQGAGIKEIRRLQRTYGRGNWKKKKGIAYIRHSSGNIRLVELHWYEAHGIGKKEIKRKRYLE